MREGERAKKIDPKVLAAKKKSVTSIKVQGWQQLYNTPSFARYLPCQQDE